MCRGRHLERCDPSATSRSCRRTGSFSPGRWSLGAERQSLLQSVRGALVGEDLPMSGRVGYIKRRPGAGLPVPHTIQVT